MKRERELSIIFQKQKHFFNLFNKCRDIWPVPSSLKNLVPLLRAC